jgi:dephospho-CoA kinase
MAFIIGLTGGIASGKSTMSAMLRDWNIPIIDADQVARDVVKPGKDAYQKIVETYGEQVLSPNGTINREQLGSIIFHNEKEREKLNEIVHPAVRSKMNEQKEFYINEGARVVVLDIPLLFESKLTHMVDETLLVYVDASTQLKRLMTRNELSEKDAEARIASQMPIDEKVTLADKVIDNNGTIQNSKNQLLRILSEWNVLV